MMGEECTLWSHESLDSGAVNHRIPGPGATKEEGETWTDWTLHQGPTMGCADIVPCGDTAPCYTDPSQICALMISLSHTTQCPHSVTVTYLSPTHALCPLESQVREINQTHSTTCHYFSAISQTPGSGIFGRIYNKPRAKNPIISMILRDLRDFNISEIWKYFTTDGSLVHSSSEVWL